MTRSVRLLALITIFILSYSVSAYASDPFTQAYLKWDAGNYIEALEDFLEILNGPYADLYFNEIATLTGELYIVNEISEDGRNPVFSPDNRHFAWEENDSGFITTKIAQISESGIEHLHTLEGRDFLFSPDGRHGVVMRTDVTTRMEELQQELSNALEARDRPAIITARNSLQHEQAVNTSLYRVNLATGEFTVLNTGKLMIRTPVFDADGTLWFSGAEAGNHNRSDIYSISSDGGTTVQLTEEPGFYDSPQPVPGGEWMVFNSYNTSPFQTPAGAERHTYDVTNSIVLHHLKNGEVNRWEGQSPVISKSGNRLAFTNRVNGENAIYSVNLSEGEFQADLMTASLFPIQHPALSPNGNLLAYMLREGISWDIHMVNTEDGSHERLSYDFQHELFPHFLNNDQVLGMMGEARHRRSHMYDVNTKEFYRLFHNNNVRTVSMENDWEPSPDGTQLLVVAQREGNTIAPEQGVYLVRIGDRISKEALIERLQKNLESEQQLLAKAEEMYAPIFDQVKAATEEVNITRLYNYQKSLYDFGSKHMTQPGNQKASEYIYETLKSFGYEPELQWFNPAGDIQTANVIARLEGTTHPEVVYILSSHFDSVQRSPGADDNSSGTAVLLEAARVLADNPQPATIIFASLTAEESGLLGAREFVRVAEEEGLWAAGVVNNDMMGWTRHHRLDNTIRFSNYGIRDVQHSGAILFTDLITYDSRYYRNTDAHVFFDAYGDVIGGIGSYPILGNPNYHQTTDRLETINHRLVQEVSRSTTATLMMLANAPSKVTGLEVSEGRSGRANVSWNRSPENDIDYYRIKYIDSTGTQHTEQTTGTDTTLRRADLSKPVSVVAVNDRGIQGWDWTVFEE
jgi:Tol biopolymer transport system component